MRTPNKRTPRLTDEELSRVLTAHALGGLERGGGYGMEGYPCCIVQASKVTCVIVSFGDDETSLLVNAGDVGWFDTKYQSSWSVEEFLRQLEARGIA